METLQQPARHGQQLDAHSHHTHTGFRLASVSKPFTAVAVVMQLVEQGQLKLSDALLTTRLNCRNTGAPSRWSTC